jgi:hypothetical protein
MPVTVLADFDRGFFDLQRRGDAFQDIPIIYHYVFEGSGNKYAPVSNHVADAHLRP